MEEFGEKNENPCFKNFSRVMGQILALRGDEEPQGFPEVTRTKYQHGFLTMNYLDQELSETIFIFEIG